MPINKNELTKEMIEKTMQCQTADELMALAKDAGFPMTKEEAEAYMDELTDLELDEITLQKIAGGGSDLPCVDDMSVPFLWTELHNHVGS